MCSGLYIHIPFCHSKCSYCDFFSTPAMTKYQHEYIRALLCELKLRCNEVPTPFDTVYIGGGTPSILDKTSITTLLDGIKPYISTDFREFTVEVNPEDVSEDFIETLIAGGVNRISMGVQSFDDESLRMVSRRHSSACAIDAINIIKNYGLNYSLDLIYGLPTGHENVSMIETFEYSLNKLLSFEPPHFSAYLLSYEQGTKIYFMREKGVIKEATEEEATQMYSLLCDIARSHGYNHYEISNFAKSGCEAVHNSKYWADKPYLGIGCSSHSYDLSHRRYNPNNIPQYIRSLNDLGRTVFETEILTSEDKYNDFIITSLRTSAGLDLEKFNLLMPSYLKDYFNHAAKPLLALGQIIKLNNRLYIPENKWLVSDSILRDLIYV